MDFHQSLDAFLTWQTQSGVVDASVVKPLVMAHLKQQTDPIPPTEPLKSQPKSLDQEGPKTLGALRQSMEAFEGCALKQTATQLVFSDGVAEGVQVMLIGEAPGADEDKQGKPFVGLSGQLLDKMFQAINLTRQSNLYITNIVPWRPPGNRQPTAAEIALCLPFIERHIALVNPPFLMTLGGTACKALLHKTEGITKLRGRWFAYQNPYLENPIPLLVTYHPAYLLRSPGQKREVWKDLLTLRKAMQEKGYVVSVD